MELEIEVADGDWFEEDPRWRAQRGELLAALRATADVTIRPAGPDGKGTTEAVIVALGSAGAFTAAVEIVRGWLARAPRRHITVEIRNGDSTVLARADRLSAAEFQHYLDRLLPDGSAEGS